MNMDVAPYAVFPQTKSINNIFYHHANLQRTLVISLVYLTITHQSGVLR
jgi:hypothetical protein